MCTIPNLKDSFSKYYLEYHDIDINKLKGDVLYLGMGNAYCARHQLDAVTSTTFVENCKEVIDNFSIDSSWKVYYGDLYKVKLKEKFDFIFINIFYKPTKIEELEKIKELYKNNLKDTGKFLYLKKLFI